MAETPRRQRNKEDKRARIHAAASRLFREHGYEGTTTRAIAAEAGIAVGTLFLYARDKDEALAFVFREDLARVLAEAPSRVASRRSFVGRVAAVFEGIMHLYAEHPALARRFLQRIPAVDDHERAAHEAVNQAFRDAVETEVERGIARGELRADLERGRATALLFALGRVHVFEWLRDDEPDVPKGVRSLERSLELLVEGFGA